MNNNECVVCKRNADIAVPLIKTMETAIGFDTKSNFTGIKTTTSYVYPAVYNDEAGICYSCMRNAKKKDIIGIIIVFILTVIFMGSIISIISLAVFSNILEDMFTFSQSIKASFIIGPFLAAVGFFILLIVIKWGDIKKSKEEREISLGAGVIRSYLNKNRRPNDYRYFTVEEWEKMQATGKHPDSFK